MKDVSTLILQQAGIKASYFSPGSRYYGIDMGVLQKGDLLIPYVHRRFIAQAERFTTIQEHIVSQGDRPDWLANEYLGDSEQFWRICDANVVMHPDELIQTVSRSVRITISEGILNI